MNKLVFPWTAYTKLVVFEKFRLDQQRVAPTSILYDMRLLNTLDDFGVSRAKAGLPTVLEWVVMRSAVVAV
jgi:hypothetical protein